MSPSAQSALRSPSFSLLSYGRSQQPISANWRKPTGKENGCLSYKIRPVALQVMAGIVLQSQERGWWGYCSGAISLSWCYSDYVEATSQNLWRRVHLQRAWHKVKTSCLRWSPRSEALHQNKALCMCHAAWEEFFVVWDKTGFAESWSGPQIPLATWFQSSVLSLCTILQLTTHCMV